MTISVSPPSLYSKQINLWVEDVLVREYLSECWQSDPTVGFLVAGGNGTIRGAVHDAELQNLPNVFGFSDRDFASSNADDWGRYSSRVYIPKVHEIENYLLDPPALCNCNANSGTRTEKEIVDRLKQRATKLCWWMACRKVISDIRLKVTDSFIHHPKCNAVTDLVTAKGVIIDSSWYSGIRAKVDSVLQIADIILALTTEEQRLRATLDSNDWRTEFSGKELFHHVRDWLYIKPPKNSTQPDVDVAKMVAKWQVENGAVPGEVSSLRESLMRRVGITTGSP